MDNGNGVRLIEKVTLQIVYDTADHSVSIDAENCPLALGQMILDEAVRVLAEKRRLMAAVQLAKNAQDNQRVASILNRGGRS